MVAVDGAGNHGLGQAGRDKLQDSHLRGRICIATRSVHAVLKYCAYYKCHTRPEHEVALATDDFLVLGVIEVAIDDLLMVMHTPEPLLDALPFQKTSGAC